MINEIKQYVVGFAFSFHEREIILIEKLKPEWQKGKYNGVGGKIEEGEKPYQAMSREFEEETGYMTNAWVQFAELYGNNFVIYLFRIELNNTFNQPKQKTDEKIQRFLVNELPENILLNLTWLIQMAKKINKKDWIFKIYERTN